MINYTEATIGTAVFTVKFESQSENRTRILSIEFQGLPIDIAELEKMPVYYRPIRNAVDEVAQGYWNALKISNEVIQEKVSQLTGIPTLDYQKVLKNQMDMITKALFIVVILLASFTSQSQAFVDFGGGAAKVTKAAKVQNCVVPVMKISAGYQFGNIVTEGILQPSTTRLASAPSYFGAKLGYNLHGFIPSIGALYNYRNADDVSMNRWEVGYALKYQLRINDNGGLFAEALYTNSSYSLTGGFNIQF
jgi:hypothetical protein